MRLKEAFQYQRFLQTMLTQTQSYLLDEDYTTSTVENHLKHKANPDVSDEKLLVEKNKEIECSANELVDFCVFLLEQKRTLTCAIEEAKKRYPIDIDSLTVINENIRDVAETMKAVGNIKPKTTVTAGYDVKFNVNGEQVRYTYNVEKVKTIDVDRNKVKAIAKTLFAQADENSALIDSAKIECIVEYEPPYDVNCIYEDALREFLGK